MTNTKPQAVRLGKLIQRNRHAAGMSLDALAARTGMDKSTISRIEQGQIDAPSPQNLQRLASVLLTDVEDYFALAGYFTPHGLPGLTPYLRAKFDTDDRTAGEVEAYFNYLNTQRRSDQGHNDEQAA